MAEGVAGAGFWNAGLGDGGFHGALEGFFAEVMASDEAGAGIGGEGSGGKDPLPGPFLGGVRVLAGKGIGQEDAGLVGGEVLGVEGSYLRQMRDQERFEASGEHGETVLLAFAVSDGDLTHVEVYVFDSEAQAFHEAQAHPVEEGGHEVRGAVQRAEDRADLGTGKDDGEAFGPPGGGDAFQGRQGDAKDFAVEEQEGVAGDILGGSGDVFLDGQMREIVPNGAWSEGGGVPFAVEDDETPDSGEVAVFRAEAEVLEADDGTDPFQKRVGIAWVKIIRIGVVGAVHAGSFLEQSSSVAMLCSVVFLVYSLGRQQAGRPLDGMVGGFCRYIGRIVPHGCGIGASAGVLYRRGVRRDDSDHSHYDLLLMGSGKGRCYGVLRRARAV